VAYWFTFSQQGNIMCRFTFSVLGCSALFLLATGCGKVHHTPVSGFVTMDGKPYANVLVTFVPVTASSNELMPSGKADSSGKFQMGTEATGNGVKPGKYKVTIIPGPDPTAKGVPHPAKAFQEAQKAQSEKAPKNFNVNKEYAKLVGEYGPPPKPIPTIYSDPKRTPLEIVEVANDPKEVTLAMKSDAK
jgi:hypothetical protein